LFFYGLLWDSVTYAFPSLLPVLGIENPIFFIRPSSVSPFDRPRLFFSVYPPPPPSFGSKGSTLSLTRHGFPQPNSLNRRRLTTLFPVDDFSGGVPPCWDVAPFLPGHRHLLFIRLLRLPQILLPFFFPRSHLYLLPKFLFRFPLPSARILSPFMLPVGFAVFLFSPSPGVLYGRWFSFLGFRSLCHFPTIEYPLYPLAYSWSSQALWFF